MCISACCSFSLMAVRGIFSSPSVASKNGVYTLDKEDLDCAVCFNEFSRTERTPWLLHCHHTFCLACLDRISTKKGVICTISCPMCRWITCTDASQGLDSILPINRDVWDHIPEGQKEVERSPAEKVHKGVKSKL